MSVRPSQGNFVELPQFFYDTYQSKVMVRLQVEENREKKQLELTEDTLSKHVLIVGGIGSGKTNLFNHMISQLSSNMALSDFMVIFDTKGEYLKEFYQNGDIIIAHDDSLFPPRYNIDYWNIFEEVLIDRVHLEENIGEISKTLFYEKLQHTTNPFFPNAAKDIFYAYMLAVCRSFLSGQGNKPNNYQLREFFDQINERSLNDLLDKYDDLKSIKYYIEGKGAQSQGVFSEAVQLVRDVFNGNFKKHGNLSIRQSIRNKGKKRIFIEYDLGVGNVLAPIYRLLIDLAIKEALCRNKSGGNVYFILDEFRLLPHLQHIDDGINFGRSLGAKFIIGVQNIQQIYEAYGENMAGSILSGLSSKFAFHVSDYETREYIKKLFGKNHYVESFYSADSKKGLIEQIIEGNVIEDWIIGSIPVGYAIFALPGNAPKIIKTCEYYKKTDVSGECRGFAIHSAFEIKTFHGK